MGKGIHTAGVAGLILATFVLGGCATSGAGVNTEDKDVTGGQGQVKSKSLATVYIQLAGAYLREGNMVAALENGKKAVAADPRNSQSHSILAIVYQALREDALAEKHFRAAVSRDSQDSDANNAFGSYLCGKQRYDEADKYFRQAMTNPLYQTPWIATNNAGVCAQQNNKLQEAKVYFQQAVRANPAFGPGLLNLAKVSYELGEYKATQFYIKRYAGVAAPTPESLLLAANTERQLGDSAKAASYEMLLRSNFPDSPEAAELAIGKGK